MARRAVKPSALSNGVTNMASRYAMTRQQVDTLLNELVTPSFIGGVAKLFSDPMDNIISLMAFPFNVKLLDPTWEALSDDKIIINVVTLNSEATYLGWLSTPLLDLGGITIPRYFNNFLDYAPYTKIDLYLPYIGFETIDTNLVMGQNLHIRYAVDLYSGKCTAYVSVGRSAEETIIMIREGQIGMNIQVAGGSGADLARSMLRVGVGAATGAVSLGANAIAAGAGTNQAGQATGGTIGSIAGIAASSVGYLGSTTLNAITAGQINVHKGGTTSANNGFYGPQNAYLIFTRPVINRPTSYESNVGRPSGKTATLGDLTGYTVVDSVHVEGDGLNEATQDELSEIERLLKTGVIL